MKILREYKKIGSLSFLVAYLFVVFLSQLFHQHSAHQNLVDENSASKFHFSVGKSSTHDCLSCHFLLDGHALAFTEEVLEFTELSTFSSVLFGSETAIYPSLQHSFYLRGPPFL